MFKRANKMTSLLVAAASVMTMVPAMAADSSATRLGTKDGTIENAVAYKDGKYVYYGYRSDDDSRDVYYYDGEKDKKVEDIASSDLVDNDNKYSLTSDGKYANAVDGQDYYSIDLSTGKGSGDDTIDDSSDTAKSKLRQALKKTNRYGESQATTESNYAFSQIKAGPKFADAWYEYQMKNPAKTGDVVDNGKTGDEKANVLFGFTNESGKYIDTANLANIYAYSTLKNKTVKIEKFNDYDSDTKMYAKLESVPTVLTQDKDNIYVLATVDVADYGTTTVKGQTTSATVTAQKVTSTWTDCDDAKNDTDTTKAIKRDADGNAVLTDGKTTPAPVVTKHYYIQKISKAQGDDKDEAYLPKTVESYEINDKDNTKVDCGGAKDAFDAMNDILGINKAKGEGTFTVANGELIAVFNDVSGEKVKATSIKFKKDKVKYKLDDKATVNGLDDYDSKVDLYLAEKDDDSDVDVSDKNGTKAYDVDVDGNVWALGDGKIYEFKNNEFQKEYTVDSSFDELSVYDENNIVAWEKDGKIFTTTVEGKKQAKDDAGVTDQPTTTPVTTPTTTTPGWSQAADLSWSYADATGVKVASKWMLINGSYYAFDETGKMRTGWFKDVDGTYYYLNKTTDGVEGVMRTGWFKDPADGNWYYLNQAGEGVMGAMRANQYTPDGYWVNGSGAWA